MLEWSTNLYSFPRPGVFSAKTIKAIGKLGYLVTLIHLNRKFTIHSPGVLDDLSEVIPQIINCCCSVAKPCLTLCSPMECSTLGFSVLHYLPKFAQIHVHWVGDSIQPSHDLLPSSPPALNLSQHHGLFQWIGCLHQVAKILKLQLQH